MPITFSSEYLRGFLTEEDFASIAGEVTSAAKTLLGREGAGADFLGWLDLPCIPDPAEYARLIEAAARVRESCDVLVVVGIGGSYLGARAAIEFLRGPNYNRKAGKGTPEILFAGCDLSGETLADILASCEGRRVCLNVISKSGTTTEPAIAFRVLREYMERRYGDAAASRILVTTDRARGALHALSRERGYETFVVPDDVGGRYSVLSPVGLLPIAAAGADTDAILAGAAAEKARLEGNLDPMGSDALRYVAARNLLYRAGRAAEVFVSYDPALRQFAEWWKQLFGESEGKDGKGLLPTSASFTTDLHSLGQFFQDGTPLLFETAVLPRSSPADLTVPASRDDGDGLGYLAGKRLSEVNRAAFEATALAHASGGTPTIALSCPARDERSLGELIYFFEFSCAVSGYLLGVNPFNQPGVEQYKKNMFALLGRPGYEQK